MRPRWSELVFGLIIVLLLALVGRLCYIHVRQGKELQAKADVQHTAYKPIPALRGSIYDRRGRTLAGTLLSPTLYADPYWVCAQNDPLTVASLVRELTGQNPREVLDLIRANQNKRFLPIKRDVTEECVQQFYKLDRRSRAGLEFQRDPKRTYPADMAGHVIGATNIDGEGLEGIELKYDKLLRGTDGQEAYIRDARRRNIWVVASEYKAPVNGKSIILTLDSVMQEYTEAALKEACEKYKAKKGCAIVMDPRTGDIWAWAVWPTIDPNNFGNEPVERRRNIGVTDPYEPGSIFKPFVASGALKYGIVSKTEQIFCHNGAYQMGSRTLHDAHGYGNLDFAGIVIHSSNIGMAILGGRMGNPRLYQSVRSFGFGQRTGVDLPGEDPGLLAPLKRWTSFSTGSIPMGQEIAATAIQLLNGFAALANDGVMNQPRLLRAVIDEQGRIIQDNTEPQRVVGECTPKAVAQYMVRDVLARVVSEGTGRKCLIPRYQAFGKTGTAQIARHGGGGFRDRAYVGSFLGGLPAADPKVVAIVSIREPDPSIGHYGGTVAAPAVKTILEKTIKYLSIPAVEEEDKSATSGKPGSDADDRATVAE